MKRVFHYSGVWSREPGLYVLLSLALCACTTILRRSGRNILSQCNSFNVMFINETPDKTLLFRELRNSLEAKFDLVVNKNTKNDASRRCELTLDIDDTNFPSAMKDDGSLREENRMINVRYHVKIRDEIVSEKLSLLHSTNSSVFKYSDYVRKKKEDSNMIESLAENIFLDVVKRLP
ncbi:MAG: hypothetical protein LBI29_04555 [Rickettsiales bacterium]|jgi:hypothetical protein|nr:hypothetical protein [Rickettsiales bacterium]